MESSTHTIGLMFVWMIASSDACGHGGTTVSGHDRYLPRCTAQMHSAAMKPATATHLQLSHS